MERLNIGFNLQRAQVSFCGYIGSRPLNLIAEVAYSFHWMLHTYPLPNIVFIILGSNDLCQEDVLSPEL